MVGCHAELSDHIVDLVEFGWIVDDEFDLKGGGTLDQLSHNVARHPPTFVSTRPSRMLSRVGAAAPQLGAEREQVAEDVEPFPAAGKHRAGRFDRHVKSVPSQSVTERA